MGCQCLSGGLLRADAGQPDVDETKLCARPALLQSLPGLPTAIPSCHLGPVTEAVVTPGPVFLGGPLYEASGMNLLTQADRRRAAPGPRFCLFGGVSSPFAF